MSNFTIADLTQDIEFIEELTDKELTHNISGGISLFAGSANAGRLSRRNGVEEGGIVGAGIIASGEKPVRGFVGYSFDPLVAFAGIR